ncbi:MAG: GNAT family N-acetyltransferase [Rhodospirillaceae bacterium]|nr:GNAT family N-acetyltransferase [Rhodospirillaceae bacterium]|tara:strand:- start:2607 stop:3167 length:561 start_codon:yes stop_codon:yes gene_type:complete
MSENTPNLSVDQAFDLSDTDIADLCDASESAILDGGGFGWLKPPPRDLLERYWRGVLLVPERELFVGRYDGRVVASAQLVLQPRNNEAQNRIATITTNFVAPWARGHGLARDLAVACERSARQHSVRFINLDVRETQEAAIQLYETLGYERWGTNPNYAVVNGKTIAGHFYTKSLRGGSRKKGRKK